MTERKRKSIKIEVAQPEINLESLLTNIYNEVSKIDKSKDPYAESVVNVPDEMVLAAEDFIKSTNAYEEKTIEYTLTKLGQEEIQSKITNIVITPKRLD